MDLTVIWALIIAFAVFMYVVMDGFDLGIGILFPGYPPGEGRDRAMNAIAPVWDGNETWLVLGGGGLFAAFPLAYAIVMPATYPLVIAMLLGLVFRGVAFEFRWRDSGHRAFWDSAFCAGSLVAALAQGMILGAILQGIKVADRAYAGSWFDWLTPYTLLTGLGTVAGYTLLGALWLAMKLDGAPQRRALRHARWAGMATLLLLIAVSLATPFLAADYWRRWFDMPQILMTSQVPLLSAILFATMFYMIVKDKPGRAFLAALGVFLLGMVGLGISIWPNAVPPGVTIYDAAAPARSQSFMLVGVVLIVPLILAYTAWAYWVFRGKVGAEGYH
ncbi:MAG: cytochrome d ubiquinol oxidase subunit II [Novosphingobium sp.]|nr:cytochrome d ubiquinol oxidase subunit II [Novosphingobium sp.]